MQQSFRQKHNRYTDTQGYPCKITVLQPLGSVVCLLAEKIGVQRTSLSRELAKMREDGLVVFDEKSITLLKRDGCR